MQSIYMFYYKKSTCFNELNMTTAAYKYHSDQQMAYKCYGSTPISKIGSEGSTPSSGASVRRRTNSWIKRVRMVTHMLQVTYASRLHLTNVVSHGPRALSPSSREVG